MAGPDAPPSLATLGYEGQTQAGVIARLRAAGVALLVDVRAIAASRRAGFSKTLLASSLEEAGIAYLHLRDLGTPKPGREAARAGRVAEMRAIYADALQSPPSRPGLRAPGRGRRHRPDLPPLLRSRRRRLPPRGAGGAAARADGDGGGRPLRPTDIPQQGGGPVQRHRPTAGGDGGISGGSTRRLSARRQPARRNESLCESVYFHTLAVGSVENRWKRAQEGLRSGYVPQVDFALRVRCLSSASAFPAPGATPDA